MVEFIRIRVAIVLILALSLSSGFSDAFVLHLKTGDRFTGEILQEDENRLTLLTIWGQQITVPVTLIEKREPVAEPPPPPAKEASPAVSKPGAGEGPPVLPGEVPGAGKPPEKKAATHWKGDAQVGMDIQQSERDRTIFHGRFKITYSKDRFRNLFDYSFAYGTTDERVTVNRMDGSSKTDFDLSERVYVYNLVGAGYDQIRKVDLQVEAGPGVGYRLFRLQNFVMNVETGVSYFNVQFQNQESRQEVNLRLAEDFEWKLNTKLSLEHKLEFLPSLTDFGAYRVRFDTTFKYFLLRNLSLNLSVIDIYNTDPAREVTKNDLQIRSAVGVKF